MRRCTGFPIWIMCLLLIGGSAFAVRVQRLSLTDLKEQAASVLVGTVTSTAPRIGDEAKMVWTDYEFAIEEVLAGSETRSVRTISFAGGVANGLDVGITGVPRLQVGTRYVLFLLADERPWATPTIGWNQGIFEVCEAPGDDGARLVSYDKEPLERTPMGLRRGPRLVLPRSVDSVPVVGDNVDREPRQSNAVVLDPAGNVIEQPEPRIEKPVTAEGSVAFASLEDLRRFVRGEIVEDREGAR